MPRITKKTTKPKGPGRMRPPPPNGHGDGAVATDELHEPAIASPAPGKPAPGALETPPAAPGPPREMEQARGERGPGSSGGPDRPKTINISQLQSMSMPGLNQMAKEMA